MDLPIPGTTQLTRTFTITTPSTTTERTTMSVVTLTPTAEQKARDLLSRESRDDLRLRISVQPGGCSGLLHQLYFDSRELDDDIIEEYDGVEIIIDKMSAPYLQGAIIDFADTIEQQGFTMTNPNAESTCACGGSFS